MKISLSSLSKLSIFTGSRWAVIDEKNVLVSKHLLLYFLNKRLHIIIEFKTSFGYFIYPGVFDVVNPN
jgi:hypothetical protein